MAQAAVGVNGGATPSLTRKEVTVQFGSAYCTLMLFDGGDSAALNFALDSRLGLRGVPFYLTLPGESSVVPLCVALPPGLTLQLHLCAQEGPPSPASPLHAASASALTPGSSPSWSRRPVGRSRSQPEPAGPAAADNVELVEEGGNPSHSLSPTSGLRERVPSFENMEIATEHMGNAAKTLDRFSRLSTDLANERTFLAWVRTVMAAIRTSFAFIGLDAEGTWWMTTLWASRLSMLTVVLVGTISGVLRYRVIKKATFMAEPPEQFGRLSMYYFFCLLAASVLALLIAGYADAWSK